MIDRLSWFRSVRLKRKRRLFLKNKQGSKIHFLEASRRNSSEGDLTNVNKGITNFGSASHIFASGHMEIENARSEIEAFSPDGFAGLDLLDAVGHDLEDTRNGTVHKALNGVVDQINTIELELGLLTRRNTESDLDEIDTIVALEERDILGRDLGSNGIGTITKAAIQFLQVRENRSNIQANVILDLIAPLERAAIIILNAENKRSLGELEKNRLLKGHLIIRLTTFANKLLHNGSVERIDIDSENGSVGWGDESGLLTAGHFD
jgi:hypothetical protein